MFESDHLLRPGRHHRVGSFLPTAAADAAPAHTVPPVTTDDGYGYYGCLLGTDVDTIIIPCGSLNAYQSDSYWGQFADRLLEDCNIGIADLDADDIKVYSHNGRIIIEGADGETVRIFDLTGRSVNNEALPKDLYFVRIGERPARKVVVM